jgi:hypothetical protein
LLIRVEVIIRVSPALSNFHITTNLFKPESRFRIAVGLGLGVPVTVTVVLQ